MFGRVNLTCTTGGLVGADKVGTVHAVRLADGIRLEPGTESSPQRRAVSRAAASEDGLSRPMPRGRLPPARTHVPIAFPV